MKMLMMMGVGDNCNGQTQSLVAPAFEKRQILWIIHGLAGGSNVDNLRP
jgi:hypothetical protein